MSDHVTICWNFNEKILLKTVSCLNHEGIPHNFHFFNYLAWLF
jgi:hypothetical protein